MKKCIIVQTVLEIFYIFDVSRSQIFFTQLIVVKSPWHIKGAFFWDYIGIGILKMNGICVLLGAIPFSK